jgi:hypothetical protein
MDLPSLRVRERERERERVVMVFSLFGPPCVYTSAHYLAFLTSSLHYFSVTSALNGAF